MKALQQRKRIFGALQIATSITVFRPADTSSSRPRRLRSGAFSRRGELEPKGADRVGRTAAVGVALIHPAADNRLAAEAGREQGCCNGDKWMPIHVRI
jgi:hypothetical protein